MKIDRDKLPKRRFQWRFRNMKPGDSFYIEGKTPSMIVQAFGYFLAKGKYTIEREGDGYRFFLLGNENQEDK